MAGSKFSLQNVIIGLILIVSSVNGSKLNVPRVLLPIFNDFSTTFTLEATEGGCYKWSTTRVDIIQLTPIDEDNNLQCSSKVVVSTVTKEAARNIAVVLAEDVHTKQMLRCDVIVDAIHSLDISTTTRELFMEEAPEAFVVMAHDEQGNEFSTLEGIEFEWTIVSLGPNKDLILRYMTFRDSPYETPPAIDALEKEDKKGYMILLEGVKSGSAKVSVRLPYPEYKHVNCSEVQLMIVANLLLAPAEVYIMVGDVVPFKVFYLNSGRMEEINLPDKQYYIEAEDQTIASSIKMSGNVTALQEGKTRIVLRDRNVGKDDPVLKLPSATLHVVKPEYIVLNILPHKNWAILVGDQHDIVADIYSSTDHKLYLGGGVQIHMEITPEFFVMSKCENGSWTTGYGIKPTVANVVATLEGVYNEKVGQVKFDSPITARAELMIYPRISISPSEVILPWDPVVRPKYDIDLIVKGGDGRFIWTSSDHSIGVVSQTGHVRTHSNGFFEVSAAMLRNHHNRQTAKFLILPPARLEIVEFVMETEIGSPVYLHIALYAEKPGKDGNAIQIPFTKCQDLPFQIKQSDLKFRQNKTAYIMPVGISCGNIAMVGLNVGTSKVTVTYYQDGRALEDSVTVSAFKPLTLLEPKREIVLAVGTSINLVYTGGPRPILGRSGDHERVVVSENEKIAEAQDITQFHTIPGEDFSVVQVLCRKLGETDIRLMISNSPAASNCKSQTSSITTRVICGKPRKITLQPELLIANKDACPMDLASGSVVVQSTQNIDLDVVIYDDCGMKFANISSFSLQWLLNPLNKGDLLSKEGIFPKNLTVGTVPIAYKSYQSLKPLVDVGNLMLNVTVTGYNRKVLKMNSITGETPPFLGDEDAGIDLPPITASIAMYLVEDPQVTPNMVTIYNHPGNKKTVSVSHGSGYFELALSADDIAKVKYCEQTKEIEIIPLKSGDLTIQVIDLCLVAKPALLFVSVVSVGIIRVEMTDKVEIGKCIPCIVRLYDENDNLMIIPESNMIDLRPEFEDPVANIQMAEEVPGAPWENGEIHFVVTGTELGDTKLVFTVASNEEDVVSAPADLQVFLPLKLHPRNGTVLIGSNFQFTVKGGPQPDANIEFTVLTPKIAQISEKGVITGQAVGTTKINAKSIGIHPSTGQRIIYSEDNVEIQVVVLQGIKIAAPLTRWKVGDAVPFWAVGIPDNISPMILGSVANPNIIFKWAFEDKQIADFTGVYQLVAIHYKDKDRVSLKGSALQAGKTRLFLNATVGGATVNKPSVETVLFQASIDIEVVPAFKPIWPKDLQGSSLLMAPFCQLQLRTNLDTYSNVKITYTLPGQSPSTELLADKSTTSGDLVTLSPTGLLKSHGILGHALLIVVATDELGLKQTISFVVEVKLIHYMLLHIRGNWRINAESLQSSIPLGSQFIFKATFHDNTGSKFDGKPTNLKIRTSRCDLVTITPSGDTDIASVIVKVKKPGDTMVKIWADGIQKTAAYVKIHVESAVKPVFEHLTYGDIICLWTPVVSRYNTPGVWRSSDSSLVNIIPSIDIGFVGDKEGVVVLTHSFLESAPLQIQILPVSHIQLFPDPQLILTNGEEYTVSRIPVVLQSEKTVNVKTNNLIQGWRCRTDVRKLVTPSSFNCYLEFSNSTAPFTADQVFNITHSFLPETGQYACKVINLGINGTDIATLRTNVTIWATTKDNVIVSEKLAIPFLPNVFVPTEIYLKDGSTTGELSIVGLPEVLQEISVVPADSSILYVDKGTLIDETTVQFRVDLIDYHWRLANMREVMGIIVQSPKTKQEVTVIVRTVGDLDENLCAIGGRSPVFVFLQNYKHAFVMVLAMLIIFFLTFYFYSNFMQPVVNVNVHPNRSLLAPDTPHRCAAMFPPNSSSNLGSSPNTSANISRNNSLCSKFNCSCSPLKPCQTREPIYGDSSNFYNADVRKNRRYM